jgi:hypothetical protein
MSTRTQSLSVTILSGEALSAAYSIEGFTAGLLHMPAAWTAASIGFQVSSTFGGTYRELSDESGLIEIATPLANEARMLPADIGAAKFVKIWSETAGSGVNQAADRVITLEAI